MPQAISKPVTVRYFKMTTWQEMAQALNAALSIGYSGTMQTKLDGSKILNLENAAGERVVATLAQTLIWNGKNLSVLAYDDFVAKYTVVNATQATSKSVEVTWHPIDTWQSMAVAWKEAVPLGFYGHLESRLDGSMVLRLSSTTQPLVEARLGENLIWNSTSVAVLDDAAFAEAYTPL